MIAFRRTNTNRITIISLLWEDVGSPALCFFFFIYLYMNNFWISRHIRQTLVVTFVWSRRCTFSRRWQKKAGFLYFLSLTVLFFSSTLPRFSSTRRKNTHSTKVLFSGSFQITESRPHLFFIVKIIPWYDVKPSRAHHNGLALWAVSADRWEPWGGRGGSALDMQTPAALCVVPRGKADHLLPLSRYTD